MKKFTIEIASIPDMDNLVAEVWYDDQMVFEINQENGIQIQFFKPFLEASYGFDDLLSTLNEAKAKLLGE
ncbi:hypothetical protein QWY85_12160 [Neolewinella lacunae]|uniref:Uncharacterized protein n=1 Tax=Neolewinella lacunae TaxID=1517758 RepID=A0A923TAC8_9BACT|nr:hypothetical protein [Neolewinella lacunae]MBC6996028.1 hypothetical protein [Neolewinella lacunae]MDN3635417.1 hypothetical protein [Neolewinella lacunae]